MASNNFWSSLHQGQEGSTVIPNPPGEPIPNFDPVAFELEEDSQVLVTLTVPDTWNDKDKARTWFVIIVDEVPVAQGLNSMGEANMRIPVTVSTVCSLTQGSHYAQAYWYVGTSGSTAYIGSIGTASLTVMAFPNIV